ncbi:MAG TPA: DUF2723 domain-containing protein [Gemmatimonadales bacterium]|nr:DUF2723 domain-containing protein [Gemmatimonadales bacterium]
MTDRPPYLIAALVAVIVLIGYILTLAPSVTFWDAGEFIATAKILGIPHPPGTPLFVMMGHVWGMLVPFGEFAWRTNLLSAVCGAAGAGLWFLVAYEALGGLVVRPGGRQGAVIRYGGAVSAAIVAAFGFTMWQNSNETEVYAIAVLTVAAVTWLALRWRAHRDTPAGPKMLLLALYLGGVSIGNHLLALLVGPALVTFLLVTLWRERHPDPAESRREWAEAAVVAGTWTLLIGAGLGNAGLLFLGGLLFGGALVLAVRAGATRFAVIALGLAAVGVTTYLFLFIRSGQQPYINEADPSTFRSLLAVIRREQYGFRSPLDDPTELHGPENPGRSLTLVGLQLLNYLQYFDWQWAKGVATTIGAFPLRTLVTLLFLSLGLRGMLAQREADRGSWWLLFTLFLTTGFGLVAYMNFEPGFSIGYQQYPDSTDHEVRERDYFFIASFLVWGVWAGMGLAALVRRLMLALGPRAWAGTVLFALAVLPFALNFTAASRKHGADARLAGDFAYNLLNSVPPYGVLFTFGDNDTFPLWWAQEVQGIRRDVTVVCLALAQTDWYMRQLRDNPARPFEPATAPAIWRQYPAGPVPDWRLHSMSNEDIANALPQYLPQDVTLRFGTHEVTLAQNTVLSPNDFLTIRVIQENLGRRPLAWGLAAAGKVYQLDHLIVQQGLGMRLLPEPPDTTSGRYDLRRMLSAPLDLPVTDSLIFGTYRYADLLARGARGLESTAASTAATLGIPFTQMAYAYLGQGDTAAAIRYLEPATRLSNNPAIKQMLDDLKTGR